MNLCPVLGFYVWHRGIGSGDRGFCQSHASPGPVPPCSALWCTFLPMPLHYSALTFSLPEVRAPPSAAYLWSGANAPYFMFVTPTAGIAVVTLVVRQQRNQLPRYDVALTVSKTNPHLQHQTALGSWSSIMMVVCSGVGHIAVSPFDQAFPEELILWSRLSCAGMIFAGRLWKPLRLSGNLNVEYPYPIPLIQPLEHCAEKLCKLVWKAQAIKGFVVDWINQSNIHVWRKPCTWPSKYMYFCISNASVMWSCLVTP